MPLRDLLKKKDKIKDEAEHPSPIVPPPDFKFVRTTTNTEEVLSVPSDERLEATSTANTPPKKENERKSRFNFHKSSHSASPPSDRPETPPKDEKRGRLDRFHIRPHSRSTSASSSHVPENLPDIHERGTKGEGAEAEWEKRATLLAQKNEVSSQPASRSASTENLNGAAAGAASEKTPAHKRNISDAAADTNIQEAIRLHEAGELERSTKMFGRLADPDGENIALAQVLYGLALRHGWGCEPDQARAVTYLTHAASNSAAVESQALDAGLKQGGAAKGELVLAIYELGNSFRHGWGVAKDPVAARHYYETAANLGDTDAMGEVAWCYLEGFGGKKDKFTAAQYLRTQENKGVKVLGNSWIWKDKYNPKES